MLCHYHDYCDVKEVSFGRTEYGVDNVAGSITQFLPIICLRPNIIGPANLLVL